MPKPPEEKQQQDTFDAVVKAIDRMEVEPERHLSIQIDTACREAIRAAQLTGKSAAVTIKLSIKRDAERRVTFAADVATKLPRPSVSAVTLFTDDEGGVHSADPRQARIDFDGPGPRAIPLNRSTTKE